MFVGCRLETLTSGARRHQRRFTFAVSIADTYALRVLDSTGVKQVLLKIDLARVRSHRNGPLAGRGTRSRLSTVYRWAGCVSPNIAFWALHMPGPQTPWCAPLTSTGLAPGVPPGSSRNTRILVSHARVLLRFSRLSLESRSSMPPDSISVSTRDCAPPPSASISACAQRIAFSSRDSPPEDWDRGS